MSTVPTTLLLYRALCTWLALAQVGVIALGIFSYRFVPPPETEITVPIDFMRWGGLFLVAIGIVTLVFMVWCMTAKPSRLQWVLGGSNIVAGVVFCLPLGVLLLRPWFSPEVKEYYGVTPQSPGS